MKDSLRHSNSPNLKFTHWQRGEGEMDEIKRGNYFPVYSIKILLCIGFILNFLSFPISYFDFWFENVLMSDSLNFFRQNDYSGLCTPPKLPLPVPWRSESQSAAASVDPGATGRIPQHHVPRHAACHQIAVCVTHPFYQNGSKSLQKRTVHRMDLMWSLII